MSKAKELINELLVEVFNNILSIEEEALKKSGVELSMREVHVLEAIRNSKKPTMTNVSEKLRITTGSLTTAINTLVKKGYVERKQGSEDKRVVFLVLKKPAKQVLKVHDMFHDEMIDSIITDLKIDEDELLIKSLESINEYFKNKY